MAELTAEQQAAIDLRAQHYAPAFPGVILLFRLGARYWPRWSDRATVERLTGEPSIPFAGAENRVRAMIEAGEKVAVCEQIADGWETIKSTARDYRELVGN